MKIALIGAGSYVSPPTIRRGAIVRQRLSDCELALMDLDPRGQSSGSTGIVRRSGASVTKCCYAALLNRPAVSGCATV